MVEFENRKAFFTTLLWVQLFPSCVYVMRNIFSTAVYGLLPKVTLFTTENFPQSTTLIHSCILSFQFNKQLTIQQWVFIPLCCEKYCLKLEWNVLHVLDQLKCSTSLENAKPHFPLLLWKILFCVGLSH
jgi:Na+-transporting NADH:ubiquinone oxidoreductase subunit NqrB